MARTGSKLYNIRKLPWSMKTTGEKFLCVIYKLIKWALIVYIVIHVVAAIIGAIGGILVGFCVCAAIAGGFSIVSDSYAPGDWWRRY